MHHSETKENLDTIDLSDKGLSRLDSTGSNTSAICDDELPDPRIQVELEKLNTSTDRINKLEVDLDETRLMFQTLVADSQQKLSALTKKLGKCVEQSKPYYDARILAKKTLADAQAAAVKYEKAVGHHNAAKEMVYLAEEGLVERGCSFDSSWQEMLNHATFKVNEAEKDKLECAKSHQQKSLAYQQSDARVKSLQKELKRSIAKSSMNARRSLLQLNNVVRMHQLLLQPYFELKAAVNHQLECHKQRVHQLEKEIAACKTTYSQALQNLERISDEIHRTRQNRLDLGVRGVGVGAECPIAASVISAERPRSPPAKGQISRGVSLVFQNEENFCEIIKSQGTDHQTSIDESSSIEQPIAAANAPNLQAIESSFEPIDSPKEKLTTGEKLFGIIDRDIGENIHTPQDLSEWQVINYDTNLCSSGHHYLGVEDRETILSDTESLTSIEMLSDEAIAGLMLEEELAQVSQGLSTPLTSPLSYTVAEQGNNPRQTSSSVNVSSISSKLEQCSVSPNINKRVGSSNDQQVSQNSNERSTTVQGLSPRLGEENVQENVSEIRNVSTRPEKPIRTTKPEKVNHTTIPNEVTHETKENIYHTTIPGKINHTIPEKPKRSTNPSRITEDQTCLVPSPKQYSGSSPHKTNKSFHNESASSPKTNKSLFDECASSYKEYHFPEEPSLSRPCTLPLTRRSPNPLSSSSNSSVESDEVSPGGSTPAYAPLKNTPDTILETPDNYLDTTSAAMQDI